MPDITWCYRSRVMIIETEWKRAPLFTGMTSEIRWISLLYFLRRWYKGCSKTFHTIKQFLHKCKTIETSFEMKKVMSSSNIVWKNSKYIYSAYFCYIRQYFPHIFARQPNSPARLKYQSTVDDSHSLQQTVIVTGVRNGPVGQHPRLSVPVDLVRRQGSRTGGSGGHPARNIAHLWTIHTQGDPHQRRLVIWGQQGCQ